MNHTAPGAVADPTMAAYMHWIDGMAGMEAEDKAIGPAINLKVQAGDELNMKVWAKYENKLSFNRNAPQGLLASALGGTFAFTEGIETVAEAIEVFDDGIPFLFANTSSDPDSQPYAYLNYLVFDETFALMDGGAMRVPATAGFDPGFELQAHVEVAFEPVIITASGYAYIWVSNESEDAKVWFDDLTISHHQNGVVTQATDYGAWGDVIREQKTNELDVYRYAYQGQFAEKDEEMGWSSFELRMFDAIIGRWLIPDPYRQYWSPYIAMGNNPVNLVDPTGGMTDCPECDAAAAQWGALADQYAARASLWNNITDFFSSLDFVADVNFRVDIGLAAKIKGSVGALKAQADVNVVTVNLWDVKGDLTNFDWSHDYVGEDGNKTVTNSIGAGVYLPIKPGSNNQIGIGIYAEQHQKVHHGRSQDYGNSAGIDFLGKSIGTKKLNNFPGKEPFGGGKLGKSKNFYGLDVGAGAQFLLGVDLNLKVGFRH
jgi:RHS repeat-associated protein